MDLNAVRERINAIDDQIVDLFVERMKASADVASAKAEKNLPVLDLRREQAVLEKVMERGGEEFEIYINKLYQTIFDISKSYQAGLLTKETALSEEILKNIATLTWNFPERLLLPVRAWRAPMRQEHATDCLHCPARCISATSRVYSMRWNPVCADMACCPSKTALQAL